MTHSNSLRRSRFAVWHWRLPWWAWFIMAVLMPFAYLLSAPPIVYCMHRTNLDENSVVTNCYMVLYWPAIACESNSEVLQEVISWEFKMLESVCGKTTD